MQKIKLTDAGPALSPLVCGFWRAVEWNMSVDERLQLIDRCLDLGITSFDHADIYGDYRCEALFGEALQKSPGLRDQMELVSKCGIKLVSDQRPDNSFHCYDTSRSHIITSVENSLHALHTDHLDVLLIHRPDPFMDGDEVAAAFAELHASGKVLHFGVSNFSARQFELLASRVDVPLVTNQVELSVMEFEALHDGTVDLCQIWRIAPMAWSPYAGGRLFAEDSEQARRLRTELQTICDEVDAAGIDQIALAWLLSHPARILPVLGTGKIERLQSAVAALDITLTREQWFRIWTASKGYEVP